MAVAAVLFLWVGSLAVRAGSYAADPHAGFRATAAGTAAALASWCAAIVLWLRPDAPAQDEGESVSRRQLLVLVTVGLSTAYLAAPRAALPSWARFDSRRTRHGRHARLYPEQWAGKFVINTKSGVIHFISRARMHPYGASLGHHNMRQLSHDEVRTLVDGATSIGEGSNKPPAMAGREVCMAANQYAAVLETMAADAYQARDQARVLSLMKTRLGVDDGYRRRAHKRPNYRLYDLWARCALAHKDAVELQAVTAHVSRMWPGEPVLRDRVTRWETRRATNDVPAARTWPDMHRDSTRFSGMRQEPSIAAEIGRESSK